MEKKSVVVYYTCIVISGFVPHGYAYFIGGFLKWQVYHLETFLKYILTVS